jgi:hypothetical protein
MTLARRFSKRRSMNMRMMKMAVWCPWLSMYLLLRLYGGERPFSHTYNNKPRSR